MSSFHELEEGLRRAGLASALAEWQAAATETDPDLFARSALILARELEDSAHPEFAALLYQRLEAQAPAELAARARRALAALQGRGGFGARFEFQLKNFARQAADPSSLAAMALAGCAYRLVRLGALSRLGPGWGSRILAAAAGFAVEVPTFTLSARAMNQALGKVPESGLPPLGEELAAAALFLGSVKLAGFGGNRLARSLPETNPLSRSLRGALPTASLFAGIGVGHRLEIAAGLRPDRNGGEALAEDLATLFQLHAAGSLSRTLLGKDWARFEQALDLRAEQMAEPPPPSLGSLPALAGASAGPRFDGFEAPRFADLGRSLMVGRETTPPPRFGQALVDRYLPLFPPDAQGYYSTAILETAATRIACSIPEFQERLIDALFYSPNRGSKEQLYTVMAIENIFKADAMRTATGSFEYSILQLLLGQTATEDHRATRLQSFQKIFLALEGGLNRQALQDLILNLPYDETWAPPADPQYNAFFWQQHRDEVVHHWSSYRPQDADLLLNFVHHKSLGSSELASQMIRNFGDGRRGLYLAVDIDATLDYARAHPLGNLVLQRLHDILATRDVAGKLTEIATDPGSLDTVDRIESLRRHGVSPEKIAYDLNGTEHTGYLNDLRLARKVVSVFQEVDAYLKNPRLREAGRRELIGAFWTFARSGRTLEVQDLINMMLLHSSPGIEAFVDAWAGGGPGARVDIRIIPQGRFQKLADHGAKTQGATYALTIPRHAVSAKNLELFPELAGVDTQDLIFIPDLPPFDLRTTEGADLAFHELVNRVRSLVHEAEHWRHANGVYFGAESASQPVRLAGVSRQERLVSEIMAYLEEFRWRVRFSDADFYELSRRLGLTLPTFLRNIADFSYFGQSNQDKSVQ